MKLLSLDTSLEMCSCALNLDGTIQEKFQYAPREHAHLLLPMVQALLAEAGITFKQIDAIAFGRGPASFTGIRIASAVVQGLAVAHATPVIPLSTLLIMAQGALQKFKAKEVLVCLDARMQQVYWSVFQEVQGLMRMASTEQLSQPTQIDYAFNPKILGIGNGFARYPAIFAKHIDSTVPEFYPRARNVAELAAYAWQQGEIKPVEEALPVYLHAE